MRRAETGIRIGTLIAVMMIVVSVGAAAAIAAAAISCRSCGKRISGAHYKLSGNRYCSTGCYRVALPRCATCGVAAEGEILRAAGLVYCTESCFRKSLPSCELCGAQVQHYVRIAEHVYCRQHAKQERCHTCRLPFLEGKTLADKRRVCNSCRRGAVMTHAEAEPVYESAQRDVALVTGLVSDTTPRLRLVGLDQFSTRRQDGERAVAAAHECGRYLRQTTTRSRKNIAGVTLRKSVRVRETISILYGLQESAFVSTASHELTHDLIAEFYPNMADAPLWVHESACQYVAALVCRRNGYADALNRIETLDDEVYGTGYRYLTHQFGADNWAAVHTLMSRDNLAKMPARPPGASGVH